jgi:predicted CopG family antitoxin
MVKSKKSKAPAAPDQQPAETFDMVFHVQLANGSATKQVRDFTNVQQLYESIAKEFGIATSDILYCTLNTHKVEMARLLGGQIGLDDFLFAHIKGDKKEVKVTKSNPALGLTISDNGAGAAFVKKIREESLMAASDVQVGDHIEKINGTELAGCRHFEVARMLKEIPIGSEFSLALVAPKVGIDVKGRTAPAQSSSIEAGAGKKTLRMKKDGTAVVEVIDDAVEKKKNQIDDMLEQFVGIRDSELAATIYEIACKIVKETPDQADLFGGALDEQLSDFEFPDDFVLDVFEMCGGQ